MTVIIVGGGITGLSLAWQLSKLKIDFVLLEERSTLGGWLQSHYEEGFFFEKGAKTFSPSRSLNLLNLIDELNLTDQIIFSSKEANIRYILKNEKLVAYPRSLFSFFTSPLSRGCTTCLFKDFFSSPKDIEDESIYSFALRKFNRKIADYFFDPLTVGIYGGNCKRLSYQSCFPKLHQFEKTHGSILKGFMKAKKYPSSLITLKEGMGSLIFALQNKLKKHIVLNEKVDAIQQLHNRVKVHATHRTYEGNHLFLATPFSSSKELLKLDEKIDLNSLTVINIGFSKEVLKFPGFGYLVPKSADKALLGMVFDSNVFEQQNKGKQTRLTALLDDRLKKEEIERYIKKILHEHLAISDSINYLHIYTAKRAIAQFEVGHREKIVRMTKDLEQRFPNITLLGNYLDGVSVDHCISQSKNITCHLKKILN